MAKQTNSQDLNNLILNRVTSPTAFQEMVDAGLINSNELYLVEGEEGITYTFADGTAGNFTVTPSNGEAQTVSVGLSNVTNHQQVHDVAWDKTNKKITRSKNGTAGDVVQFVQGDNITLTAADGKLTIASSFTNSRDPGYGKIKPGAASSAVTGITANTTSAEASTYNETLTINPGNKWIQLAGSNSSTAGSDTFTIGHALSGVTAGTTSPNTAQTPGFNSTFNIPTVTFDAAGHITSTGTTTVKIPAETALSGGSAAANDATVAGGVTVSGHAVTVAKKTLTAGGGIKITGATDKVTIAHSNTSITAKTAAAQSAKTLTWGGTFTLYEEKYDAYGHITGVASYNMTMPANPNTDEKVKQNLTSENASYKLLTTTTASPTSGTAYEANYSANLAYNPSENKLSTGNLDLTGELDVVGNANLHNQTNIDSATVGSLLVNGSANFNQIPTAPTAAAGTSNTQLATTEFVTNATSGLSSAMHFIGKATVAITDGSTTNPTISGYDFTADRKPGDVIIDSDTSYEYVWTLEGKWERLGPDGSYKTVQSAVSSPSANGNATAFIDTISQNANGVITVTKKNLDTSGTWSGNATTATTASKLSNTSKIGDTNKPVYFKADGTPAAISYTIDKSVPSNAVFTDRYVNSATFADDSTNTAASPIKMTLTRAGSDTATVTANIPKVSSSSAGVAPKGAAVSSQSQTTKFLREDGTWATPSYTTNTNTTYTFTDGTDGSFSVTPSGGSAQTVSIGKPATAGTADVANSVAWSNVTGKPSTYYTLPTAADSTLGGIKTGYSASGKNYAIKVDSNGNAYVNVPWTDNNTTSFTITANATDGLWDLTGTNGTNAVTYALAPYSTKQSSTSFYTAATNPTLTTRLNYDGYFYATKLYSGGAEVLTSHQSLANYKTKQTAVSDPTASNTAIAFIDSISQDANGVITPTKKTVRSASTSQTGVIQITADNANSFLNQLSTGSSTPTDADYYISQYVGGGTTTTTYHRRPMSALWDYIKGKITNGIYWANEKATSSASYKTTPEVAKIKLNGNTSASAASTKNVELVYDATLEVLNFVFS